VERVLDEFTAAAMPPARIERSTDTTDFSINAPIPGASSWPAHAVVRLVLILFVPQK